MEANNHVCKICRQLSLERISNAASCEIRGGYGYPNKEDDLCALVLGVRVLIRLSLKHIRSFHSECPVCNLVYQQLDKKLFADHEVLEGYVCKDLDLKLQSLWIYVQGGKDRVTKIDIYGIEG